MSEHDAANQLHMMQGSLNLSEMNVWMGERAMEDIGHALHCLLTETLGEGAPRQFRLLHKRGQPAATVLGYTRHADDVLVRNHRMFATPQQERAMPAETINTKVVPDQWEPGTRLSFDVRCRPLRQRERQELDAYDVARKTQPERELTREEAYIEWLSDLLERKEAATLEAASVETYQRSQTQTGATRRTAAKPEVTIRGLLTITDGPKFGEMVAAGIGRHRSYGFGMLLIKPPVGRWSPRETPHAAQTATPALAGV